MKRKRYTEDLEFKISDEEADDADAAGRDSPSNTSQSEQQVSGQHSGVCLCIPKIHCKFCSRIQEGQRTFNRGVVHRILPNALWEISCLALSFKIPCSLKSIIMQVCDM